MDLKRLLFVIPLAVLTYLLIMQWNQDYSQHVVNNPAPEIVTLSGNGNDDSNALSAPADNNDNVKPVQDNILAGIDPAKGSNLIQVQSDVLDLRINPNGGDIVYAALFSHEQALDSNTPFVLLSDNNVRSYVAKSGLQIEGYSGRIPFAADRNSYQLSEGEDSINVDLHGSVRDINIIKRFVIHRDDYAVKVEYLIDNKNQQPVTARFIGQLARDQSQDPTSDSGVGMHSFLGAAFSSPDEKYSKVDFEAIRKGNFQNRDVKGGWVAMIQHYFTSAWVPNPDQQNLYYGNVDNRDRIVAAFAGPNQTIEPDQQAVLAATLFIGPKVQDRLEAVAPNLELTIDFGWLWFLANPLFWLLEKIHGLIGNWGWSIVLLTACVKIMLFPLAAKAYKSMARMRKMGPEMKRLKEQYGNDRQRMSQEVMKFYQKEKINPLGGCLPMVIQMPVFIALYWMLMESVELRHAPFMLWINDLSAKDPYFILPIIMGATMLLQQLLNPTPPDPMQAKIMKMLPVIFTFFFLWFPAGLVIYWIVNNSISILQQLLITNKVLKEDAGNSKAAKTKDRQ